MGFGTTDRLRLNVVCKEAPGVIVYTDPAGEDEGDLDSIPDGNYGAKTLEHNERIHYSDLKDRYRQRRDRTRQLVAQLATLNTRKKLDPTEVRPLAKTLSKEDIRKYSKFETLANTICDQQDALDEAQRWYGEQVQSSSAQLAHLTCTHEARLEQEVRQAKAQVDMANGRVQASEAQAQLHLQEQTQRAEVLISELRRALTETTDHTVANTRDAAEMEVQLRKDKTSSRRTRAGMGDVYRQA